MSKTTVVIPNYKGIDYIEDCLNSLVKSSVPIQIIMVDNASGDGSLELVREKYPQVSILTLNENTGFSKAVNEGILVAKTDYVLLLNNDTVVGEDMVEHLETVLDADASAFSVAAKMINLREPDKLDGAGDFYSALGWAFARGKDKPIEMFTKADRIFSASAGAALYRRSMFTEVGYFDENHFAYLEDIDIGYRGNICGYHNRYEPKALVYHAGSAVSGSRHNDFKVRLSARNSIYLIYKNMPLLQVIINLPFLLLGYLIKVLFFIKKGMGSAYLGGIKEGFALSFSKEGRRKKLGFKIKNLKNYLWIQGQLWINMVRRFLW